jgi:hypothetical protein
MVTIPLVMLTMILMLAWGYTVFTSWVPYWLCCSAVFLIEGLAVALASLYEYDHSDDTDGDMENGMPPGRWRCNGKFGMKIVTSKPLCPKKLLQR